MSQTLELEYLFIVHYPRLSSFFKEQGLREQVYTQGYQSVRHADIVARAIQELGGQPRWAIAPFPKEPDLVKIFETQLEKEKLALWLQSQAVDLVPRPELKEKLRGIGTAEKFPPFLSAINFYAHLQCAGILQVSSARRQGREEPIRVLAEAIPNSLTPHPGQRGLYPPPYSPAGFRDGFQGEFNGIVWGIRHVGNGAYQDNRIHSGSNQASSRIASKRPSPWF